MAKLPLEGTRVLDLTAFYAGPMAGRLLADMGAEIIKIESIQRMDGWRGTFTMRAVDTPYEYSCAHNGINVNKYGITLNLGHPEGAAVFKRLAKISDVVLENFSPRVMGQFGLEYEVLKVLNPKLVMVSMPGFGATGPWKDYLSFAATIECLVGINALTGYEGGEPLMQGAVISDPLAGMNGAVAALMGLFHARQTEQGLHIDLSQTEAMTCMIGDAIMDYTMNGRVQARKGNTDPSKAPYGCYRCKGEDKWVVIGVSTDEEWKSLCRVLGDPDWSKVARFADPLSRNENREELDKLIELWTVTKGHDEAMYLLQEAGVPAGAVLNALEIPKDPHFIARGHFQEVERVYNGRHQHPKTGIKLSKCETSIRMPAPILGEHNEFVLGEILGLSEEEIARLADLQVIGKKPIS